MEQLSSYMERLYWMNSSMELFGGSDPLFKDLQLLLQVFKLSSASRSVSFGVQNCLFLIKDANICPQYQLGQV
jgi:hypothetical protein